MALGSQTSITQQKIIKAKYMHNSELETLGNILK
jgi:hypothetical protein